jgi:hypothetical protein
MDGKKVLVGLVAAAGIAVGGLVLMKQSSAPRSPASQIAESMPSTVSVVSQVMTPAEELLPDLNKQTIAFFVVSPRQFDVVVPALEGLRDHFASTAVWKKYELDKLLAEAYAEFGKSFKEGYEKSGENSVADLAGAQAMVYDIWSNVNEALLAFSSKTFDVAHGVQVPETLLSFAFKDSAASAKYYELLEKQILMGKPELKTDSLTIKHLTDRTGLDFELTNKEIPKPLHFVLVNQGNKVFAMFGGNDPVDFLTANPADRLSESEIYKKTANSALDSSGMSMFINTADMARYLDSLLTNLKVEDAEVVEGLNEMKKALLFYSDFDAIGMSGSLKEGFGFKSCVVTKPGSQLDGLYDELFKRQATAAPAHDFYKLVDEHTMLANRFSFDILQIGLKAMELKYADPSKVPGTDAASAEVMKNMLEVFKKVEAAFDRYGFREGGFVVNTAAGTPIPSIGLYLGGSKLSRDVLIQTLGDEIKSYAASPEGAELIKIVQGRDGNKKIEINMGPGMQIQVALVSDNAVVATIDPSLVLSASSAIKSGKGYLDGANLGSGSLRKMIVDGDYFFYLNTDATIEMAKPFLPMLISQSPTPIDMNDVDEILNKLRASLVSGQISGRPAPGTTCSEGRLQIVK